MATRSFSPIETTSRRGEEYRDAHISINRQRKEVENLTPLIEFNLSKWVTTTTAGKREKHYVNKDFRSQSAASSEMNM